MTNWIKVPRHKADKIILDANNYGNLAIVPTLNKKLRQHWAVKKKDRATYGVLVGSEMIKAGIKKAKKADKFVLIITSYRPRLMDPDNLVGAHKWMIDALRDKGFIYDDDPDHIHLLVEQHKATKKTGEKIKTLIERINVCKLDG